MSDFETRLLSELARVKETLRRDASLHRMTLVICAEGRMDGDLLVTFKLGEYAESVEGGRLDAVLAEFLRQRGWSQRHAPLCLPNAQERAELPADGLAAFGGSSGDCVDVDEVPF